MKVPTVPPAGRGEGGSGQGEESWGRCERGRGWGEESRG